MMGKAGGTQGGPRTWEVLIGGKPAWVAKGRRGILARTFPSEEKARFAAHADDEALAQQLAGLEGDHWNGYGVDVVGREGFVIAYNPRADEVFEIARTMAAMDAARELIDLLDQDFPDGTDDAPTSPKPPAGP